MAIRHLRPTTPSVTRSMQVWVVHVFVVGTGLVLGRVRFWACSGSRKPPRGGCVSSGSWSSPWVFSTRGWCGETIMPGSSDGLRAIVRCRGAGNPGFHHRSVATGTLRRRRPQPSHLDAPRPTNHNHDRPGLGRRRSEAPPPHGPPRELSHRIGPGAPRLPLSPGWAASNLKRLQTHPARARVAQGIEQPPPKR